MTPTFIFLSLVCMVCIFQGFCTLLNLVRHYDCQPLAYREYSSSRVLRLKKGLQSQSTLATMKLALFNALVAYLLKSSSTMNTTRKALASDPLFTSQVELLHSTLDSAEALLSKVCMHIVFILFLYRLPHFVKKSRTIRSWKQRRTAV